MAKKNKDKNKGKGNSNNAKPDDIVEVEEVIEEVIDEIVEDEKKKQDEDQDDDVPGNSKAVDNSNAQDALENNASDKNNAKLPDWLTDAVEDITVEDDVSTDEMTPSQLLAFIKRKRLEAKLLEKLDQEQREYYIKIMEEIGMEDPNKESNNDQNNNDQNNNFDINSVLENEQMQNYIQQKIDEQVNPLKSNNSKLLDQLTKARTDRKSVDDILQTLQDEKELENVKSGNMSIQDLIDRRVTSARNDWQPQLEERDGKITDLEKQLVDAQGNLKQFQLKNVVGTAALNNKFVNKSALDDILSLANGVFESTEGGDFVPRDGNGNILMGANGKPQTADEWIQSLAEAKPHYFTQMSGTGSNGSSNAGGQTVSLAEWQNLLATSDEKTERELLAKKANGEIRIAY